MSIRQRASGRTRRWGLPIASCVAALVYVALAVAGSWRSPDVGFRIRVGLEVVHARPDSGVHVGDRIEAIDGVPLRTAMMYARWQRSAENDRTVVVTVRDPSGATRDVTIVPEPLRGPVLLLVMAGFSVLLLAFGLLLRLRTPEDLVARSFWASTLPFPFIYVGALAAPRVLADPLLMGGLAVALGLAPAWLRDFFASFPTPGPMPSRRTRRALLVVGAVGASVVIAIFAHARSDAAGDDALRAGIAGLLVLGGLNIAIAAEGLRTQYRRTREATSIERAQLKWLLIGFGLVVLNTASIVPGALGDPGWFSVGGFAPLVAGGAICWFGASTLAILRVRLATIDAVIPTSLLYATATRGSLVAAALTIIAVGTIVHQIVPEGAAASAAATAIVAAVLFGPGRQRLRGWIDAWSLRDRSRYVERLHEATGELAPLRDRSALVRAAVDRAVAAVHADSGALYLPSEHEPERYLRAHATGARAYPDEISLRDGAVAGAGDLFTYPIAGARVEAILVLGPRLGGDAYGDDDRHLLGTLARLLATAFETARTSAALDDLGARLAERERELDELRGKALRSNPEGDGGARARDGADELPALVGNSTVAVELRRTVERLAGSSASVLLTGETGAGKGNVARAIHRVSERAAGPLVHVDCGAIAAGIFESELFGHERGAFTGADRARAGLLELADGGTLFLDEIGELPLALQPKLLRALQERSVMRVGGSRMRAIDLRVIAATNRDLEAMVREGTFREDLYYRLRVVEVVVPPLRERLDDLPAIIAALGPRLAQRNGGTRVEIAPDALAALRRHTWPGNIRELENVLERSIVLGEVTVLRAADLVFDGRRAGADTEAAPPPSDGTSHREYLDAVERGRLIAALEAAGGNRALAARNLGIPRTTLVNKLRRFRIGS